MSALLASHTIAIAANLSAIRARIAAAATRAGRDPQAVRLVAITKTFPFEVVLAAYAAGQREFGENRVQEAEAKITAGIDHGLDLAWHLVGHLQTNKATAAATLFDTIQSVDSVRVAQALSRRSARGLRIFIEVNVAGEASKSGFALEEVGTAVDEIRKLPGLDVRGLMTVAPQTEDAETVRPVFRQLALLARELALPELSMGMSGDFEVAVDEGATVVRVGTAIFGHRS